MSSSYPILIARMSQKCSLIPYVTQNKFSLDLLILTILFYLQLVQETYSNEPHYLEDDDIQMKIDPNCNGYKLYVSNSLDEDPDKPFCISKLNKVIDRFVHIVSIDIVLPDTDIGMLKRVQS